MATHRLDRLHVGCIPDITETTGECFPEPYSLRATNDTWRHQIWRFGSALAAAPTVRHGFFGVFEVPQNYVGTPVLRVHWTSTITTGNVVWDFDYRTVAGDDTTSLDQLAVEEAVTVTDAAPTATDRQLIATVALTAANFTAGDTVLFGFFRDGADAADTMAGSAQLHNLVFSYADA